MSDFELEYTWRSSAVSATQTYRLENDALIRETDGQISQILWSQIREVRVEPFTDAHARTAYHLRLIAENQQQFVLQSSSWSGLAEIDYNDPEFLQFAKEIHRRLLPFHNQISFLAGPRPRYIWAMRIVIGLLALVGLVFAVILAAEGEWGPAIVFAGIGGSSLLALMALLRARKPVVYDPFQFIDDASTSRDNPTIQNP